MEDVIQNIKEQKQTTANLVGQFSVKIKDLEKERKEAMDKIEEYQRKVKEITEKINVLKDQQNRIATGSTVKSGKQLVRSGVDDLSKSYRSMKQGT